MQTGPARWALSIPKEPGARVPRGHHSTTLSRLHVARSLLLLSFLLTATEDGASHLQNTHHPGCHMGRETSPAPCQRGRTAGTTRDSQARSISSPLQALDSKPVCTMHSDSSPFNLSFISPHCLQNVWRSPAQLPWSDGQNSNGSLSRPTLAGPSCATCRGHAVGTVVSPTPGDAGSQS